jgi:hypothetical protein
MNPELEDYFVPNERNKYAPHVLQKAAVIGMVVLVFLSFTIANVHSLLWIGSQWLVSTVLPAVIVDLTNNERQAGSLGTLRRNSVLDEAARMKAEHMAKNEYFAHYSPDGVSPWFWFGRVDYNFVHAGENLAIHFTDSEDVVDAWMDSPTHRANVLNGNYTEIGVGTAEGTYEGYDTVYVVQLFGTPAAAASVAQAEPEPVEVAVAPITPPPETVLSESVTLTEDVKVYEAEPVAVPVEAEDEPSEDVVETPQPSEEEASNNESTSSEVVIADMEETPYGVALYSDLISTSTGGVPATIQSDGGKTDQVPFFLELATQPHTILQILYIIIGLFVFAALLISILIEIKQQHPVQIMYGSGLLAIMGLLYYVHMVVSQGALIV